MTINEILAELDFNDKEIDAFYECMGYVKQEQINGDKDTEEKMKSIIVSLIPEDS